MRELGHKQAESTLTGRTTQRLFSLLTTNAARRLGVSILLCGCNFVAQAVTEGSVRVRYTPTDMNLADVLTKAVPAATFERLVKLCLDSKRGEYYAKVADEKVNYVSDKKTWMVTDMW
jgi:hypothetical protein